MEHHVFAVWDFMSLLTALQRVLTCTSLPWVPKGDPLSRRLINEIVLAEESDEDGEGGYLSHFEMYRMAMDEAGANLSPIDAFIERVGRGEPVPTALKHGNVPLAAVAFVETTWAIIELNASHQIAAAFALGREAIIPPLFLALITEFQQRFSHQLDQFQRYLNRHIALDEERHAPMAFEMLETLCGESSVRWQEAEEAAAVTLRARRDLWDGIDQAILVAKR